MELRSSGSSSHSPPREGEVKREGNYTEESTMTTLAYRPREELSIRPSVYGSSHYHHRKEDLPTTAASVRPQLQNLGYTLPGIRDILNLGPLPNLGPPPPSARSDVQSSGQEYRSQSPTNQSDTVSVHSDSHSLQSAGKRRKTSVEWDYSVGLPSPHCSPPAGPSVPRTNFPPVSTGAERPYPPQCFSPSRSPLHTQMGTRTNQVHQGPGPHAYEYSAGGQMLPPSRPVARTFEPPLMPYGTPHYPYEYQQSQPYYAHERSPFGFPQQNFEGYSHDTGSENKPRKRRGNLPKDTTQKLRDWINAHMGHPYPTEDEKQELMRQTGLQMNQISNWFINARRRWLPGQVAQAEAEKEARAAAALANLNEVPRSQSFGRAETHSMHDTDRGASFHDHDPLFARVLNRENVRPNSHYSRHELNDPNTYPKRDSNTHDENR